MSRAANLLLLAGLVGLLVVCPVQAEGKEIVGRPSFNNLPMLDRDASDKPIQRHWLQSMTPAAIREGFAALRTDASMQPLADAAVMPLITKLMPRRSALVLTSSSAKASGGSRPVAASHAAP